MNSFRLAVTKTQKIIYNLLRKYYVVIGVLLVIAGYVAVFHERTVAYNYGGDTCVNRLIFAPGAHRQVGSSAYNITHKGGFEVFGRQFVSTKLCITPTEAPKEGASDTIAYAPWGGLFARTSYRVTTGNSPVVDSSVLQSAIPVTRALAVPLSQPDTTFEYTLSVKGKQADCKAEAASLYCDVPSLKLRQGSTYTLALEKHFKQQKVSEVANTEITTLSPLKVTSTSIKQGSTVYHQPTSLKINVDKPLEVADVQVWRVDGKKPVELASNVAVKDKAVTVSFAKQLPRQARVEVRASTLESTDGSTPLDPYTLKFKTSGGPKVTSVNVGSSGVGIGTQIIVTFDQKLSDKQDIAPLIETGGGVTYSARQGNQLIFSTSKAGRCQSLSISLKPTIESPYGIAGQSGWQYNGRTTCYTVSTIGYSSQGRSILAYQFGSSGSTIVYTGAIHGDEYSTKSLMDRWIQELDANPGSIPSNKKIIVIPAINPDGVARGTRTNARNVDLNRNFATSDWKKDIQHTNGSSFPGGGGKSALSEPESKAIASFIAQRRPALVVSYHSIGGLVISNQAGQASTRASQYASYSGYALSSGGGAEFEYEISGTADDYYRETLGLASILVELGSHSYHQFERNKSAMWAMMR